MPATARFLALGAAGLALTAVALAASTDPITLDDIVALLKAGAGESLILKQVAVSSPAFTIGVQEVLRLKEAGASDSLIEALMRENGPARAAGPAAEGLDVSGSFRIFKEVSSEGREILHITNLDPSGRRLGGGYEAGPEASPNRYESEGRGPSERPDSEASGEYAVIGERSEAGPVIVNVYPPAPPAPGVFDGEYQSPYMYRDPYAYRYPRGRLPGYYPGSYAGGCRPYGVVSPPGSYSHFRMFHTHYGGNPLDGLNGWSDPRVPARRLGPHYRSIGPASAQESLVRIRGPIGLNR